MLMLHLMVSGSLPDAGKIGKLLNLNSHVIQGYLEMHMSAHLGHPDHLHFPPPLPFAPPNPDIPSKKKSPSHLRRQERRQKERYEEASENEIPQVLHKM